MGKSKIVVIGLSALLVVSIVGNVIQYTQLQATQELQTTSTAKIDELSAKLTEQATLLEKQAQDAKQLQDELATQALLLKYPSRLDELTPAQRVYYDDLKGLGLGDEEVLGIITESVYGDPSTTVPAPDPINPSSSGNNSSSSSPATPNTPTTPPATPPATSSQAPAHDPSKNGGMTRAEMEAIAKEIAEETGATSERGQERAPGDGAAQDKDGYSPLT